MIVDTHTHYLPSEFVEATCLTMAGVDYRVRIGDHSARHLFAGDGHAAGFEVAQLVDLERRQEDMDRMGVDIQVLSVPPPFGFFYEDETEVTTRLCRVLNAGIAQAVSACPDRFIGMATLPMQDTGAAVETLEHAVSDLGLAGAEIATRIGERNLDDPKLDPFFSAAERLRTPIFVHSTRGFGAARFAKYHLGNLLGNPTEDATAVASLIFGGVVERHPNLKLYVAHGGGSCPAVAGRWDRGWRVRPEARLHISDPPSTYLRRITFDSLTHGVCQLRTLVEVAGAQNVLLGTDYPYDMAEPDPVGQVRAADLSPEEGQMILEDNAARMFGLPR